MGTDRQTEIEAGSVISGFTYGCEEREMSGPITLCFVLFCLSTIIDGGAI